jgi:hypothetical protein
MHRYGNDASGLGAALVLCEGVAFDWLPAKGESFRIKQWPQ